MEITKRNGTTEPYDREKIAVAIRKSFASTGQEVSNEIIYSVVEEVENLSGKIPQTVVSNRYRTKWSKA